ncbi:MAG: phosphatase PAP2 family protein [Halobacterium sp.]
MSGRGVGVTNAVAGSVPEAFVPVLAALTFLGSTWFVTTVGPAVYLFGPRRSWLSRRDGVRLLAASIGALALVVLAKGAFAMPRPPEAVMLVAEDGNGFPSGHATGAAAFYGALAALACVGSRARRWLAAGALIALVAFTRVALGVHYLVDVVAGAALGAAFVAAVLALTRRRVDYGFGLAVGLAVAAVAVLGPTEDAVAALGGTVGAFAGWRVVTARDALERAVRPAGVAVVAVLGATAALTLKTDAALPVVWTAHAVAGVAFVALPAVQNVSR